MEDDPRIAQALAAIEAVGQAKDYMIEAQVTGKGIFQTTHWKRLDKELGAIQVLYSDLKNWALKVGITD